jgi:hypothetical protein
MTDQDAIRLVERWHRCDISELPDEAMERVLELAELGLPRKPPEGSIPVRIPIGYDAMGNVSWKGYVRGTGEKYSDVTAWFDEVHGRDRDAVAIVTAWLPPVVQPEVSGEVQG